jgi:hypothetical protein
LVVWRECVYNVYCIQAFFVIDAHETFCVRQA